MNQVKPREAHVSNNNEAVNIKSYTIERRHAISSLDVSIQKKNAKNGEIVDLKDRYKKSSDELMKKSSSSSDKLKSGANTSSSSDRIDEETNNFYEQCSISSSMSSTTSSNNFPNIQINESENGAGDEDNNVDNDFDEQEPLQAPIQPSHESSFNYLSYSNKYRLNQTRKELDDPFLRDLTACLQMKQKKVLQFLIYLKLVNKFKTFYLTLKLTELNSDLTALPLPIQTHKLSPTFNKPSFCIPTTTPSNINYNEVKLTTRATSPILLDSNRRIINSSCSYSSISAISSISFSVSLKSSDETHKSTSHNATQTDEEQISAINRSKTENLITPSLTLIPNSSSTRQIKCVSFIQPKSLVKFEEQPSVVNATQQTTIQVSKPIELKTPSPPPSLPQPPTLKSIQKSDHDQVVKAKPYQLMSFNIENPTTSPAKLSTPQVVFSSAANNTISSKVYTTSSTNTETVERYVNSNRVDKYTNTETDEFDDSKVLYASAKKNIEVQTQTQNLVYNGKTSNDKKINDLELVVRKSQPCKVNLEYLLKCYLMNDFRKNDLNRFKEKLFHLMVLIDTANPSLQIDNRRFTSFNNGLIKCLNRNMIKQLGLDDPVSFVFLGIKFI